jgi:hypothetical protein
MPHPDAVQIEPMHDRTNPSKPTQRGTNHGRQHGGQRMTLSVAPARIGNSLKKLQQALSGQTIHGKTFSNSRTNNGGTFMSRQTPEFSSYFALHFQQGKLASRAWMPAALVWHPAGMQNPFSRTPVVRLRRPPANGCKPFGFKTGKQNRQQNQ